MRRAKEGFRIWQWNCRSYENKKSVLQQYLKEKDTPDDIILQETHGIAKQDTDLLAMPKGTPGH